MFIFPMFVAAAIVAVIAFYQFESTTADQTRGLVLSADFRKRITARNEHDANTVNRVQGTNRIPSLDTEHLMDLVSYDDPDYGFSVAIPSGWQKIVAAESEENFSELEPGYAVGFESPNQGTGDQFADYVLIEVLPGKDSGLFETDGENRQWISIDGQDAWMDRLDVKGESGGLTEVDLTIFQTEMSGLGYTIGLYAIGEPSREKLMSEAFEIIIRTFRQTTPPFPIS